MLPTRAPLNRRDLLRSLAATSLVSLWPIRGEATTAPLSFPERLHLIFGPDAPRVWLEVAVAPGEGFLVRSEQGRVSLTEKVVAADARGHLRIGLVALAVGEPEQPGDTLVLESAARSLRCEVWIEPALGQWRGASDGGEIELGLAAVHAALVRSATGAEILLVSPPRRRLPDGRFAGDGRRFVWDFDAVDRCELARLDARTLAVRAVPFEHSGLPPVNLFCSGHVHQADGRLLFAGGHVSSRPGDPVTAGALHRFDARGTGEGWQRLLTPLRQERWYPSLVLLPDGRVLIASGSTAPLAGDHRDHRPLFGYYPTVDAGFEIFDPRTDRPSDLDPARAQLVDLALDRQLPREPRDAAPNPVTTYPALFVLTGGPAGVLFVQEANRGWLHEFDPRAASAPLRLARRCYRMVATRGSRSYPHYGSAVLLPFADGATRQRILVVGGQHERAADHRRLDDQRPTTDTAEIFDYDAGRPLDRQSGWRAVGPLTERRALCDATLLADGSVLISGGVRRGWANANRLGDAVYAAEVFDPHQERFRPAATAHLDRRYHSTALLLTDGTVLKMGSTGGFGAGRDETGQPWTRPRFDAERFWPGYLWRGPRPVIDRLGAGPDAPLIYGARFEVAVTTSEPEGLRLLALRLGSVTHGLDMDQRGIYLNVIARQPIATSPTALRLTAQAPTSGAVAPPGDYQLVVIDGRGVPSCGRLVRFGA